jgi:methyl-accepting chemotaxis protein
MRAIGRGFAAFITNKKPDGENDMADELLGIKFDLNAFVSRYDKGLSDPLKALIGEQIGKLTGLLTPALEEIRAVTQKLERLEQMTKEQLQGIKTKLEASNATISEIAGDMAELKGNADTLSTQVADLKKKIEELGTVDPEVDALVTDIDTTATALQANLRSVADVVPEIPSEPVEPTEPTEPGTGGGNPSPNTPV